MPGARDRAACGRCSPGPSIEKTPGEYDWTETDAVIRETTNRGIQPFVFLYGTPEWAARRDGYALRRDPVRGLRAEVARDPGGVRGVRRRGGGPLRPRRLVLGGAREHGPGARYGGTDPAICEITSRALPADRRRPPRLRPRRPSRRCPAEPPCGCTDAEPDHGLADLERAELVQVLRPEGQRPPLRGDAAQRRGRDPGRRPRRPRSMLGGMWGPHSARQVVTPTKRVPAGALRRSAPTTSFDSIAIHPYAQQRRAPRSPSCDSARRVLVNKPATAAAKMWVTEVGWAGRGPADNPYVKGLDGPGADPDPGADRVQEQAPQPSSCAGCSGTRGATRRAATTICDWCGHAGLRAKDGAAKPAWRAFVRLARR